MKKDKKILGKPNKIKTIKPRVPKPRQTGEGFYCTNANLLLEMYKWRNSSPNGFPVMKMLDGKLVKTQIKEDIPQKHEKYKEGTKYYIKYEKSHKRYEEQKNNGTIFYSVGRKYVVEDVTRLVKNDGWAFNIDEPLDRVMSEDLGKMIMLIA